MAYTLGKVCQKLL